jgi:hypothetical protein
MKTKMMIAASFLFMLSLSAPQQAQAVKDTRPKPGPVKDAATGKRPSAVKDTKPTPDSVNDIGVKKIPPVIDAKAEFCIFSEEGIGPLVTADPNPIHGCLWHQEYTFRIRNKGLATAPSTVVQLTIINTFTKEQRVINKRISVLKPGQVATVNFKFSIVADEFVLKLDAKGEVEEVNENNNVYRGYCELGGSRPCLNDFRRP